MSNITDFFVFRKSYSNLLNKREKKTKNLLKKKIITDKSNFFACLNMLSKSLSTISNVIGDDDDNDVDNNVGVTIRLCCFR